MKTLKLNLVLLVTLLAVFFSNCSDESIEPAFENPGPGDVDQIDDLKSPTGDEAPKIIVKAGIPATEYQGVFDQMTSQGYRLIFIDGFLHTEGNSTQTKTVNYFNAIFEENVDNIAWKAYHGLTSSGYQSKFNDLTSKGYRLTHIESYPQNSGIRYAPIFAKVAGPSWIAYHGKKIKDHQAKFEELMAKGYRLVNRSIVKVGDQEYVAALYDKKDVGGWVAKSGLDEDETQAMMEENYDKGRMLGFLDISQEYSSKFTYGPIFNSDKHEGWYALNKLSLTELKNEIADAESKGYRTNIVVGYDVPGSINGNEVQDLRFAASWVK